MLIPFHPGIDQKYWVTPDESANRQLAPTTQPFLKLSCARRNFALAGLRRELTVRAVEEGPVSEHLGVPKAEAQEQEGNVKRGPTTPIVTAVIPPIGQLRTDR